MWRLVSFIFLLLFGSNAIGVDYTWQIDSEPPQSGPSAACSAHASGPFIFSHVVMTADIRADCWCTAPDLFGDPDTVGACGTAFRSGDSCPEGKDFNSSNGECEQGCQPGSLAPNCAVECPAQDYTYFLDGVARRGRLGYGKVGYGQSCPQPSFPPGSDSACVGTPGTCADFEGATNENEDVTSSTTTEATDPQTGDKTTTTTTNTQTGTTSVDPNPGSGGPATDTDGNTVDIGNTEGASSQTVDIGENTFALCEHGGIVDGTTGCDYNPPTCDAGQVASSYGCVDRPQYEPPETPETTKSTESTDPQTGDKTTTTTETTGTKTDSSGGVINTGGEENKQPDRNAGGGQNCSSAPTCSGDGINCAILYQTWKSQCAEESDINSAISKIEAEIAADTKYQSPWATEEVNDFASEAGNILNQSGFLGGGSCPADRNFNSGLVGSITVSYQFLCDFASTLSGLVLAMAGIVAARNVARAI